MRMPRPFSMGSCPPASVLEQFAEHAFGEPIGDVRSLSLVRVSVHLDSLVVQVRTHTGVNGIYGLDTQAEGYVEPDVLRFLRELEAKR